MPSEGRRAAVRKYYLKNKERINANAVARNKRWLGTLESEWAVKAIAYLKKHDDLPTWLKRT